jgi:hypothetical protein
MLRVLICRSLELLRPLEYPEFLMQGSFGTQVSQMPNRKNRSYIHRHVAISHLEHSRERATAEQQFSLALLASLALCARGSIGRNGTLSCSFFITTGLLSFFNICGISGPVDLCAMMCNIVRHLLKFFLKRHKDSCYAIIRSYLLRNSYITH